MKLSFLRQEGIQELDVPLLVRPSSVVFLSSWKWVLPFCSLYSTFFGCFGLFMIGTVSSIKSSFENWERV